MEIPGYHIEGELGRGGMSTVYLAVQQSLQRKVALKVMNALLAADPDFTRRFLKEGQVVAHLSHLNIVTIYDIGRHEADHYISMEYLPGNTLKQRLNQGLDRATVLEVAKAVAAALGYAHQRGIIHRDIKPQNILFRENGAPVLTDFGVAKTLGGLTVRTVTGYSLGSPMYMSPEQARGRPVDPRSDLYGLGVLIYEMLTGRPPFETDDPFALAFMHVSEPVPALPAEAAEFQPLLERLLAKEPDQRYDNAAQVIEALERLEQGQALGSERPEPPPLESIRDEPSAVPVDGRTRVGPVRRRRRGWLAGAVVALLLAGVGIWLVYNPPPRLAGTAAEPIQEAPDQSEPPPAGDEEQTRRAGEQQRQAEAERQRQAEAERQRRIAAQQAEQERQRQAEAARQAEIQAQAEAQARRQAEAQRQAEAEQRQAEAQRQAAASDPTGAAAAPSPSAAAGRQARIADLKSRFETHLERRELTVGSEGSALDVLEELAAVSPDHPFIDQGRRRIALAYAELARADLDRGRYDGVRRWLELGESVRPGLAELAALAQQLTAAQSAARQPSPATTTASSPGVGSGSAGRIRLEGFDDLAFAGIDAASVQRFVDTRLARQGGRLDAGELQALVEAITGHIRSRGLVAARAFVVRNSGGTAVIRLAPGRLEKVEVDDNFSSVERRQIGNTFGKYRGQPLVQNTLVNEAFGLYQLLGVTVGLAITPGQQPGGSDLRVKLNDREWINYEGNLRILSRSHFLKSKFVITAQGQGVRAPGN